MVGNHTASHCGKSDFYCQFVLYNPIESKCYIDGRVSPDRKPLEIEPIDFARNIASGGLPSADGGRCARFICNAVLRRVAFEGMRHELREMFKAATKPDGNVMFAYEIVMAINLFDKR